MSGKSTLGAAVLAVAALLAGCSSAPSGNPSATASNPRATASSGASQAPSSTYPKAMVVLGHSRATGFGSDPAAPGADAVGNSWATGDTPAVDSISLRLLSLDPAIKGHAGNVAVAGSDV